MSSERPRVKRQGVRPVSKDVLDKVLKLIKSNLEYDWRMQKEAAAKRAKEASSIFGWSRR